MMMMIPMDYETHRNEESNDLDHGIVSDNPKVSIPEERSSSVGENLNPKQMPDPMDEGTSENSSNSDYAGEIVITIQEENDELRLKTAESDEETLNEKVIVVNSEENRFVRGRFEPSKVMVDESVKNVPEMKAKSCVVDVRSGNGERVCRICHLGSEGLTETKATGFSGELIQLGCGCKDELGIAHGYCAEAWFRLKGNRVCEICGEVARNIRGVAVENMFMEEWNRRRYVGSGTNIMFERSNEFRRHQHFCNILMACLIVAFVLPWFFHLNMS